MTNIYATDSDEKAIMDHEELYDKTNEHFKTNQGRSVSERIGQQSQDVCQGLQGLV